MSTMIRQGQVDLAKLVAAIRDEFPDLSFADATLIDSGEDHAVVLLDDIWVFRFPRTAEVAVRGATERRLLMGLNAASSVATPRYTHLAKSGDFGGYRMIAGLELTQVTFAALPREVQERVLGEIGDFLRVLHGLPVETVACGSGRGDIEGASWFADRYAERRERLAAALGASLSASADRFYDALPAAVATSQVAVTHGDLTADHILLSPDQNRLAGIIDFADAGLGDPAFDFTCFWAYGGWATEHVAKSYSASVDNSEILARSLWWFTRYRIDQVWWSVSGARDYDVPAITQELEGLFDRLGI